MRLSNAVTELGKRLAYFEFRVQSTSTSSLQPGKKNEAIPVSSDLSPTTYHLNTTSSPPRCVAGQPKPGGVLSNLSPCPLYDGDTKKGTVSEQWDFILEARHDGATAARQA